MSRNTNTDTTHMATSTTTRDTDWRDEHGKPIAGGVAGGANASGVAGVSVAPGETVRVEKVTRVTTVRAADNDNASSNRQDSAYTAGVTGSGTVRTGSAADTHTSSATAGRIGGGVGGGGTHASDHTTTGQTTTSSSSRNTSGTTAHRDYSPDRRAGMVGGGAAGGHDSSSVRQRTTESSTQQSGGRGVGTTTGVQQRGGVYAPSDATRSQYQEGHEDTHGWRAERLTEDQQLEGSGKPMMLDAVAGTRNTRMGQQPYGYRQTTTTQYIAGQDTSNLLKYLVLIPLALLVPLFLASLIGIPFLGKLIPWTTLFPFLKHLGLPHRHRHVEVSHSRLHKGYEVVPSTLFEDTTKPKDVYVVPIEWEHLLKNQKWADVVLVANDNTQINAHKVVLAARSPVLEKELDTLIQRGKKERRGLTDVCTEVCSNEAPCKLTLKNVDGKLLKSFVEFLYSGRVLDRSRVEDLLALGQAYEVPDLQDAAAEELIYNLDASTAGDALILGHDYNHCGLRRAAKAYIRDNWKQVHGSSYFKSAVKRRSNLLTDDYIHSDRDERTCHLIHRSF